MDLTTLPAQSVLSDSIRVVKLDNVNVLCINHAKARAAISLFGGHLLSYQPADKAELIWMSQQAKFDGQTALRGGIPICWPWFGRIAAPAHGFARTSEWQLSQHRENEHGVIIELSLQQSAETLKLWPFQFDARLQIEVADTLTVTLVVTNTDQQVWRFSGALHSYLNVADIHQVEVTGMGSQYIDSLQDAKLCQGGDILTIDQSVDRVYTQPEDLITVRDKQLEREVQVRNHGDNCAVIWNPWQQGARAMADMPDDGYLTMLCVESTLHAASLEQGKLLAPGESYQLATTLSAD
ncbi:D-hexose-6-phosphate mutarotase [Vibrio sp.]|uniref:D-hexose-6-phosphate mutarotase n=1 Tax=Vibrio sp. TaxID=678 RepID=UPI003D098F18